MMDALVHIMFEVAGTSGALLSVKLIKVFGNNFSFFVTPPLFAMAGLTWSFIDRMDYGKDAVEAINIGETESVGNTGYLHSTITSAKAFARSTYKGAVICVSHRRFIWLLPGYSFACMSRLQLSFIPLAAVLILSSDYGHRYLDTAIAPVIAKRIMLDSSYSVRIFLQSQHSL